MSGFHEVRLPDNIAYAVRRGRAEAAGSATEFSAARLLCHIQDTTWRARVLEAAKKIRRHLLTPPPAS
jgi:hypothetical protein